MGNMSSLGLALVEGGEVSCGGVVPQRKIRDSLVKEGEVDSGQAQTLVVLYNNHVGTCI